MRRVVFTILASSAMFAVAPASALAHQHHHRSHRRSHHHQIRVRHEQLGGDQGQPGTIGAQQSPGTVQSFAGGRLTIALTDGSTVSGAVTNATELRCEAPGPAEMQNNDHGSGGDNGNPGGDQGQGDNGDRGDDQGQGEDQQGDEQMCAAIKTGMLVREADLTISSAGAVWNEVDLIA